MSATSTSTSPSRVMPPPATSPRRKQSPRRKGSHRGIVTVVLVLATIWTVVPLGWMLLSSFKDAGAVTAATPSLSFSPTLENYTGLFDGATGIGGTIVNSLVAAIGATVLSLILGTLAGYGLARTRMRRRGDLAFWIISVRMAPIAAVILPLFLMFRFLGLIDTLPGLIIAYMTFNLPFAIWLMSAFFAQVPLSLEESAMTEGATRWQTFWQVCLPLVTPGLVTTGVLCLVFAWNDYAFATVFAGPQTQTLPVAASQLVTSTGIDWGRMTAIGTIVVIPMMIAGLAVRRWLVTGLTLGAVTGE